MQEGRAALRLAMGRAERVRLYKSDECYVLEVAERTVLVLDLEAHSVSVCPSLDAAAELCAGPLVFVRQQPALKVRLEAVADDTKLRDVDKHMLLLVTRGLSNQQIAEQTGCAESTVKNRLTRLFTRFGVHTRSQMVATVLDLGLLADALVHKSA